MNQEKVGNFIARCRKAKKMTQSELAEQLGVTDRSVSNWENGKICLMYLYLTPYTTIDDTIYYDTLFYDVIRCNKNGDKESFRIIKNQKHNDESILTICN